MKETILMSESQWNIMACICVLAMFGFCAGAEEGSSLFPLSSNGCGRATAYAATNKIITADSKTHASWLDSEGGRFGLEFELTITRQNYGHPPTTSARPMIITVDRH